MQKILAFFSLLILMTSCQKEQLLDTQVDHRFWLKHAHAEMPVAVRGNTSSRTFIITLHGGPGSSAHEIHLFNSKLAKPLEEKYAMVYWDQRNSGISRGTFNDEDITIELMIEDLDLLVDVIYERYGADIDLYLQGFSWGGYYGFRYLTTDNYQEKIKGWIDVAGLISFQENHQAMLQSVQEIGNQQIAVGNFIEEWRQLMNDVAEEDSGNITFSDDDRMFGYISRAERLISRAGELDFNVSDAWYPAIFKDNYQPFQNLAHGGLRPFVKKQIYQEPLNDKLSKITIPVKLIYGKWDVRTPQANGEQALKLINTPDSQKSINVFERSDHSIAQNEPERLAEEMIKFIEEMR